MLARPGTRHRRPRASAAGPVAPDRPAGNGSIRDATDASSAGSGARRRLATVVATAAGREQSARQQGRQVAHTPHDRGRERRLTHADHARRTHRVQQFCATGRSGSAAAWCRWRERAGATKGSTAASTLRLAGVTGFAQRRDLGQGRDQRTAPRDGAWSTARREMFRASLALEPAVIPRRRGSGRPRRCHSAET